MPEKGRFRSAIRVGVTPRAALLVVGVLVLQLGFIASYLGAFHHPRPDRVAVAVAAAAPAPAGTAAGAAARLDALPRHPVEATAVSGEAAARSRVTDRRAYGAYVLAPSGPDRLYVASAEGASVSTALVEVFGAVSRRRAARYGWWTCARPAPATPAG